MLAHEHLYYYYFISIKMDTIDLSQLGLKDDAGMDSIPPDVPISVLKATATWVGQAMLSQEGTIRGQSMYDSYGSGAAKDQPARMYSAR